MARGGLSDRGDRGAVALVAAAASLLLVTVAAFAVDLGMQRVVRADMQALADVVALDAARLLDGSSTAGQVRAGPPSLDSVVAGSVARNGTTLGDVEQVEATLVFVETDARGALVPRRGAGGALLEVPDGQVPDGVFVEAAGEVDFAFRPGSGAAQRSALSASTSFACYKLGSWAAALDTTDSVLLNPLLQKLAEQGGGFTNGGAVRVLDYRALASGSVDLDDLAVELGAGSVDQLATSTVSLHSLYAAIETLATPTNATTVSVLGVLAANAKSSAMVQMGRLLSAETGAGSLAEARANVLDLVGGSLSLLNGTNVANVYLASTLPGLSNVNFAATLLQGPRQYCGAPGTGATIGVASDTEQLNVHIDGTLAPTDLDFSMPSLPFLGSVTSSTITAQNHVSIDVSVAGTSSSLRSISCDSPDGVVLDVQNGLATVTLTTPLRAEVKGELKNVLPGLLPGSLLDSRAVIRLNAAVTVVATVGANGVSSLSITVPPQQFDTPYPTSSGGVSILSTSKSYANISANVELLGGLLGAGINLDAGRQAALIDAIVASGLTSLFDADDPGSLTNTVFAPILALVGARIAGSDAILDSSPELSCASPRLVG